MSLPTSTLSRAAILEPRTGSSLQMISYLQSWTLHSILYSAETWLFLKDHFGFMTPLPEPITWLLISPISQDEAQL